MKKMNLFMAVLIAAFVLGAYGDLTINEARAGQLENYTERVAKTQGAVVAAKDALRQAKIDRRELRRKQRAERREYRRK